MAKFKLGDKVRMTEAFINSQSRYVRAVDRESRKRAGVGTVVQVRKGDYAIEWQNGYGIVMPPEVDPAALPATRATLEMIAALDARCVIPGHGEAFTDVRGALERAFARTAAFEADPLRTVRHLLKALLVFSLLDRERMLLAALPDYMARIGVYRDFNMRFFNLAPSALAEKLVGELERAGAVHRDDGWLKPGR